MTQESSQTRMSLFGVIFVFAVGALTVFAFLKLGPLVGLSTGIVGAGAAFALSALWNPPRAKPPLPAPAEQKDPVAWAVEHDAHRYDPGYWTGGRLHPVLRSGRSGRYGVYLVFASFVTLVFGAFAAMAGAGVLVYLLILTIGAVQLAAGWALLRRGRR